MDRIDPGRKSLIGVVKKRSDSGTSFYNTTDTAIHFSEHYCDKRYNWRDDPSQWTRVIHDESPSEHWVTVFEHTVMVVIGLYSPNFTAFWRAVNVPGGSRWPKSATAPHSSYRWLSLFAAIYRQGSGAKMKRPLRAWIAQLVLARLQAARSLSVHLRRPGDFWHMGFKHRRELRF
jgi:hypothetical protein